MDQDPIATLQAIIDWLTTAIFGLDEGVSAATLNATCRVAASLLSSPILTLSDFASEFLRRMRSRVSPPTWEFYERGLRLHVLPALGELALEEISRRTIKTWASGQLEHAAKGSVGARLCTLRVVLSEAVDDGIIPVNHACGIMRSMRIKSEDEKPKAMTAEQLGRFLNVACPVHDTGPSTQHGQASILDSGYALGLLTWTGLRLGEALALRWEDVDLEARTLEVQRQIRPSGEIAKLKTAGSRRKIHLPSPGVDLLRQLRALRLSQGERASPWVLFPDLDTDRARVGRAARQRVAYAMRRALKLAGLPSHFHPHSLRHTWATILVECGADLKYVQNELGHASIKMTSDLYAKAARPEARQAVRNAEDLVRAAQASLWPKRQL